LRNCFRHQSGHVYITFILWQVTIHEGEEAHGISTQRENDFDQGQNF
jgi:hypothetical protein